MLCFSSEFLLAVFWSMGKGRLTRLTCVAALNGKDLELLLSSLPLWSPSTIGLSLLTSRLLRLSSPPLLSSSSRFASTSTRFHLNTTHNTLFTKRTFSRLSFFFLLLPNPIYETNAGSVTNDLSFSFSPSVGKCVMRCGIAAAGRHIMVMP